MLNNTEKNFDLDNAAAHLKDSAERGSHLPTMPDPVHDPERGQKLPTEPDPWKTPTQIDDPQPHDGDEDDEDSEKVA